jgi:hypothetical protein
MQLVISRSSYSVSPSTDEQTLLANVEPLKSRGPTQSGVVSVRAARHITCPLPPASAITSRDFSKRKPAVNRAAQGWGWFPTSVQSCSRQV